MALNLNKTKKVTLTDVGPDKTDDDPPETQHLPKGNWTH